MTVRPPHEERWLVAILEEPRKLGTEWVGRPDRTPVRDITPLLESLKFASGTGISAKPGALAMSLQTPRVLTSGDVSLLQQTRAADPSDRERPQTLGDPSTLPKVTYEQLAQPTENEDAGTPEDCVNDDTLALAHEVDPVTRAARSQHRRSARSSSATARAGSRAAATACSSTGTTRSTGPTAASAPAPRCWAAA